MVLAAKSCDDIFNNLFLEDSVQAGLWFCSSFLVNLHSLRRIDENKYMIFRCLCTLQAEIKACNYFLS